MMGTVEMTLVQYFTSSAERLISVADCMPSPPEETEMLLAISIIGDAKEITIRGSQLSPNCYPDVIEAFRKKLYTAEGVVSHRFTLDDWDKAYATARTSEAVKVILVP